MTYEELEEKAIKKLNKRKKQKRGVYTVGVIFTAVSIILFTVSQNFPPMAAYWIKFPILVLALVYGVIYFSTFGIPFLGDDDELSEEEIEREMVKIYRHYGIEDDVDNTSTDALELKDIEAIKNKWEGDEDFV